MVFRPTSYKQQYFVPYFLILGMVALLAYGNPLQAHVNEGVSKCVVDQAVQRVEIPEEDLPARIQEDLQVSYYDNAALFVEAFEYMNDEGQVIKYEVRLQREGKDLEVIYDKDGKPMKGNESE